MGLVDGVKLVNFLNVCADIGAVILADYQMTPRWDIIQLNGALFRIGMAL